ncbi:MAG: hypothetical protein ACKO17_01345, partial [Bacteroidota bacterium]
PVWVKFSDSLGGIRVTESVSGFASPRIADFNRDGFPDLVVGSESGKVFGFPSLWNHLSAPRSQNNLFCYNSNGGLADSLPHGNFLVPACADLDGDSFPDLVLGYMKGGLVYWQNRSTAVSVQELTRRPQSKLSIRPHPVRQGQMLEVVVDDAYSVHQVSVYDLQGRLVGRQTVDGASRESVRLCAEWLPGPYLLQVHKKNGPPEAARFWVVE